MKIIMIIMVCFLVGMVSYKSYGNLDSKARKDVERGSVYDQIYEEAEVKDGVREISYGQLSELMKSGEEYILLDVLSGESYDKGHIEGAVSFPLAEINGDAAAERLSKTDNIVVYCGSFKCMASTRSAISLSGMGYKIVDYKGGLKEWQDKGNSLVK